LGRVLMGASTVIWDLSFMWVLGVMGAFRLGGLDDSFAVFGILGL
jgi:hypothetical protein